MKAISATKEQVEKDIIKISKIFKKQFPDSKEKISRDFYRANGKYGSLLDKFYGSFKNAIAEVFKEERGKSREDIDIKKISSSYKKRYLVSAIVPGQKVNEVFMQSIELYCKKEKAELILLVMRGIKKDDVFSKDVYDKYSKYFHTELTFNSNLKAMDFLLLPQQIISLTGLDRIARSNSVIVAHTKQEHVTIPVRITEYPHIMWSTGVVTYPNYGDDRIGKIAMQDHTCGGLIVEVVDNKIYHVRNFQADKNGYFAVFNKWYRKDKITNIKVNIVMGDIHCGAEDPIAISQSKQLIKELDCKYIYFNDLFDGRSVNHHEDFNIYAQYTRPVHQQTLEDELNYLGNFLQDFTKGIEDRTFIVVPSNHNDFVSRWLAEGKFVFGSPKNAKLGAELFTHYLDGEDPIEYYLKSRNFIKNIKIHFATRNEELKSFEHTIIHGDKGVGAGKGSAKSFDKCYDKNISAHGHSPKRFRSSSVVGINCDPNQPYIAGTGSGWMATDGLSYENGTDSLINKIKGSYKL
jgi:hypothetical protein